jgi:hypothetical protein
MGTIMPDPNDLEASVDRIIADCGGDARAAVRALIVMVQACEAELLALHGHIDQLVADLSPGTIQVFYARVYQDDNVALLRLEVVELR